MGKIKKSESSQKKSARSMAKKRKNLSMEEKALRTLQSQTQAVIKRKLER